MMNLAAMRSHKPRAMATPKSGHVTLPAFSIASPKKLRSSGEHSCDQRWLMSAATTAIATQALHSAAYCMISARGNPRDLAKMSFVFGLSERIIWRLPGASEAIHSLQLRRPFLYKLLIKTLNVFSSRASLNTSAHFVSAQTISSPCAVSARTSGSVKPRQSSITRRSPKSLKTLEGTLCFLPSFMSAQWICVAVGGEMLVTWMSLALSTKAASTSSPNARRADMASANEQGVLDDSLPASVLTTWPFSTPGDRLTTHWMTGEPGVNRHCTSTSDTPFPQFWPMLSFRPCSKASNALNESCNLA